MHPPWTGMRPIRRSSTPAPGKAPRWLGSTLTLRERLARLRLLGRRGARAHGRGPAAGPAAGAGPPGQRAAAGKANAVVALAVRPTHPARPVVQWLAWLLAPRALAAGLRLALPVLQTDLGNRVALDLGTTSSRCPFDVTGPSTKACRLVSHARDSWVIDGRAKTT
jgi:hypothetical protein